MHFIKVATHFILGAILATGAISSPVPKPASTALESRQIQTSFPFNGWGGFQSLNGFDDFFGVDNFIGIKNQIIILPGHEQFFCKSSNVGHIQQQLFIFQELIKKLILEEICEVEVQIILLQQFTGGFDIFFNDLNRFGGKNPGFDKEIAKFGPQLFDFDGKFKIQDFGFKGHDIGKNIIIINGGNFKSDISPPSIKSAFDISSQAKSASLQFGIQQFQGIH
jgi:hypothetical protein